MNVDLRTYLSFPKDVSTMTHLNKNINTAYQYQVAVLLQERCR